MISENKINQILNSADIVRVIGEYYPLKSTGKNYKTLCPFHQEKTPSFIVSSEKQIFHCFGCGKGGNVFHFIMEQEKLSFPEAVKFVGEKVGIKVEDTFSSGKSSKIYSVLEKTNSLFKRFLYSQHGKKAHQYLLKRGINDKIIKDFSLGYAPLSSIQLKELREMKLPSDLLQKGGIIQKKDGKEYPYFRNRIIFPIFNPRGKVIALGGRALNENSLPKYLNSPETEIFEKGKTLYGLHMTRKHILTEKKAIIVEGYIDLISLYEAGIKNVVAPLGTSLTRWQIRTLSRFTDTVYIIYDSDTAGEKASLRSLELLVEEGLNPLIVTLPAEEDPDSYIRKHNKKEFDSLLNQSLNIVEFYLKYLKEQYNPKTTEGKINISKIILPVINKIESSLRQDEYIKILAEKLSTSENILREEMIKQKQPQYNNKKEENKPSIHTQEELILSLMIEKDNFINGIQEEEIDEFQDEHYREIAKQIYKKAKDEKINSSSVLNLLSTEARETLSKIMAKEFHYQNPEDVLTGWRKKNITRKITQGKLNINEIQTQIERLQKLF